MMKDIQNPLIYLVTSCFGLKIIINKKFVPVIKSSILSNISISLLKTFLGTTILISYVLSPSSYIFLV